MSPRDRLWERVHAALDAREDPLGDVEVQALLAGHPEELLAVLRVAEAAQGVAKGARPTQRRRPAHLHVASLALGGAAVVAILLAASLRSPRRVELVPAPEVASVLRAEFVHDDGRVLRRRSVDALSGKVITEVSPSRLAGDSDASYRFLRTEFVHGKTE
jgi:hypothetical protein